MSLYHFVWFVLVQGHPWHDLFGLICNPIC